MAGWTKADLAFRIYYGDGSVYEGEPEGAPNQNVQAIAWNDPAKNYRDLGRVVLREWDIYIYSDDIGWHGTNKYADLLQHLGKGIGKGGVRAVLTGRWITRRGYDEIIKRAETDEDLEPKSACDYVREDGRE